MSTTVTKVQTAQETTHPTMHLTLSLSPQKRMQQLLQRIRETPANLQVGELLEEVLPTTSQEDLPDLVYWCFTHLSEGGEEIEQEVDDLLQALLPPGTSLALFKKSHMLYACEQFLTCTMQSAQSDLLAQANATNQQLQVSFERVRSRLHQDQRRATAAEDARGEQFKRMRVGRATVGLSQILKRCNEHINS